MITWRKAFWWIVILVSGILMLFTNLIPNGIATVRKEAAQQAVKKKNFSDLELISLREPWTATIYNNIQIATEHRDANDKISYSGGTPIKDLLALVGPANTADQRTDDYDGTKINTLTWESEYNPHLSYWVEITVAYDTVTGLITEKKVHGSVD